MKTRQIQQLISPVVVSDGAGVRIQRTLGQSKILRFDPFLMLDEFGSDDPQEYLAGFPDHPHRGFETITYMLEGHMLHQDHMGNHGQLQSGDVQWMTAGRGIIHSEMPQQDSGLMRGFQLWLNLPAKEKMQPPAYRDIKAADIPKVKFPSGGQVAVIAGAFNLEADGVEGAAKASYQGPGQRASAELYYFDVQLPAHGGFTQNLPSGHSVMLYVYEGELTVGGDQRSVLAGTLALLDKGERLAVAAGDKPSRFLLLAAKPIGEPIVQWGPFVMNTQAEVEQAVADYRSGRLVD